MMRGDWYEEVWCDYGYTGGKLRCGHNKTDVCDCWCDGHKPGKQHLKDECTHDNCVYCECQSCGMPKNPKAEWCEVCTAEEESE